MGKNSMGLDYKYNWLVGAFRELGPEACNSGIHPGALLRTMKLLRPGKSVAGDELAYVRTTLSHYRVDISKHRTARMRTPELFVMLGDGLWTLKQYEEERLAEEQREQAARVAQEGKQSLRQHLARERSPIAKEFKLQRKDLSCEACGFNFEAYYGELGRDYIEAHHILPLDAGPRQTRINDFRAVCANCHRMIHRKGLATVEQLGEIIAMNSE